jgi:hypothetical protein
MPCNVWFRYAKAEIPSIIQATIFTVLIIFEFPRHHLHDSLQVVLNKMCCVHSIRLDFSGNSRHQESATRFSMTVMRAQVGYLKVGLWLPNMTKIWGPDGPLNVDISYISCTVVDKLPRTLHFDNYENLFSQLVGEKDGTCRWIPVLQQVAADPKNWGNLDIPNIWFTIGKWVNWYS